jgi:FMN reductase
VPIYNYDVSASAKNLVELTGSGLEDKVVGFLCAAGGHSSYMSVMSFANQLMLDFRCLVLPRFVYATAEAFDRSGVKDPEIQERIDQLAGEAMRIADATSTQSKRQP